VAERDDVREDKDDGGDSAKSIAMNRMTLPTKDQVGRALAGFKILKCLEVVGEN
jgi:hypothetical protein